MSDDTSGDPTRRPMPWEPGGEGQPPDAAPPDAAPADSTLPEAPPDATPTEVVPATPPAGIISAAPVGWGEQPPAPPSEPTTSGTPPPAVGWGSPEPAGRTVPGAPGFVFADTGSRVVAWLVDGLITGLIGGILATIAVGATGATFQTGFEAGAQAEVTTGTVAFWAVTLLVSLVYFVLFWTGGRRATPGQRLLKIQVGNAHDGRNLGVSQAAVRWIGYGEWLVVLGLLPVAALSGIGAIAWFGWPLILLLTTIVSPTKQGLHDRLAGTWLVKPADASNSGLIIGCLVLLVLLVILPLVALVGLIAYGGQIQDILSAAGESI